MPVTPTFALLNVDLRPISSTSASLSLLVVVLMYMIRFIPCLSS